MAGGILGGDGDFWTLDFDVRRFHPVSERRTLILASLLTLQPGEIPGCFFHFGGGSKMARSRLRLR